MDRTGALGAPIAQNSEIPAQFPPTGCVCRIAPGDGITLAAGTAP
jgi:hypothetical protein